MPHQKQTYLSLSRSLVHRQTWRLTGGIGTIMDRLEDTLGNIYISYYISQFLTATKLIFFDAPNLKQRGSTNMTHQIRHIIIG